MPVQGRKPNPDGQRRHRVKPVHDWTEVTDEPFDGAPSFPRYQPNRFPWPDSTKKWWKVISRMPHCALWSDSDWQFALDTAFIAAAFHSGELKYARELRQREKIMGTTADALRDLRIRYVDPRSDPEDPASVTAIQDYRKKLTKKGR